MSVINEEYRMIVIQGAGITGLVLAGLLERRGLDYRLVERTMQMYAVGAGIVLQRNALEVLDRLHEADFDAVSTPIEQMLIGSAEEPVLQALSLDHASRARGVHRGDLQQFLLQQIDPARLCLGTSVESWKDRQTRLDVTLSSGECLRADVLVGADGIASGVRRSLSGAPRVRDSGQWCARTVVAGRPTGADAWEIHAGRHRLGVVPLAGERSYVFWVRSHHPDECIPQEDIEASVRSLGPLGGAVAALFTPRQSWLQHPLTDIPISWGRGRVVLVGDAAHALTPNLGQGAALGIEDAYVLAGLLGVDGPHASRPAEQLRRLRHARVSSVRRISYLMGKVAHLENPRLCRLRSRLLKATSPARSRRRLSQWLDRFPVEDMQPTGPRLHRWDRETAVSKVTL
jgi:2-polyprenyl-6-methoxyphenol hydroxylase-like FAD-dependent oxidoreductase